MNKVYVGIPTTYILMSISIFFISIFSGSLRSLADLGIIISNILLIPAGVFIGSIVCTLGVSLLIWIPIWWVIGSIVIAIAPPRIANILGVQKLQVTNQPVRRIKASPSQLALANYIKKAENTGLSDQAIFNRLLVKGWTQEEIESAQEIAHLQASQVNNN